MSGSNKNIVLNIDSILSLKTNVPFLSNTKSCKETIFCVLGMYMS